MQTDVTARLLDLLCIHPSHQVLLPKPSRPFLKSMNHQPQVLLLNQAAPTRSLSPSTLSVVTQTQVALTRSLSPSTLSVVTQSPTQLLQRTPTTTPYDLSRLSLWPVTISHK